ncbi:oligosaccharide flippase family protein, partial [candidate division KSB1 bacterium]|nr:oligosaccharide flippase family protein [candidate division KSB1 bacterium]
MDIKNTIKLKKYIPLFFSSEAILLVGSFISFPIFTRILTKGDYGLMSLINLTITFAVTIGSLGLRHSVHRYFLIYKKKINSFFSSLILGILFSGVIISILIFLLGLIFYSSSKISSYTFSLILLTIPLIFIKLFNNFKIAFLRIQEQIIKTSTIEIIIRYLGIILSILFVSIFKNLVGFFLGLIVAEGVISFFLLTRSDNKIRLNLFDKSIVKICLLYGFPLMADSIVTYLLSAGDRYIISYFLGNEKVAEYTVVYNYCEYPFAIVRNALLYSFMPIIMNLWNSDQVSESKLLLKTYVKIFSWVTIPIVFGLSAISADGISLLAGNKYINFAYLTPIISSGIALTTMNFVITSGLIFKKKTMIILMLTAFATILNIFLNLILIPKMGLEGAAIATLISYIVFFTSSFTFSIRELRFSLPFNHVLKAIISSFLMYLFILNMP